MRGHLNHRSPGLRVPPSQLAGIELAVHRKSLPFTLLANKVQELCVCMYAVVRGDGRGDVAAIVTSGVVRAGLGLGRQRPVQAHGLRPRAAPLCHQPNHRLFTSPKHTLPS
ncbi:hypothetical protein EVAR_45474_1 [Eumeta japonica]|uniref:Uncharacterized protein n=1 Tax=Eumeta variegata TaxID=151549 RepID=A0A4C1WDQ4_EUMVA|nr:hypothetical protein EVAR_45474_1 [Eumeta japonica]